MNIEYDSDLCEIEDEEIDSSGTVRPYMYETIRRESDEDSEDEDVKISSCFDDREFQIVQTRKY